MKRMHTPVALAIFCFLLLAISCKKENVTPPASPVDENTQTPIGTPDGTLSKKTIDAAGGELASADGIVKIIIPAGALAGPKEISIQPIINMQPSGIGKAYRISPHGEQFARPVSLVFHYTDADLENTIAEGLDIAFQDDKGSWQALYNTTVDKANKKISVTTTHFSDWTRFKSMRLSPQQATVELGGQVELKLTTTFPYIDPDDDPNKQYRPVYTSPRELRADEIKGWSYQGDGILVSRGSNAYYTAPDHEPSTNPEAVTANINLHRKGQFMLVSHITVLAGHGVDYLQVDEDHTSPLNGGKCMLYLWGKFGNDPGAAKRSVVINGVTVPVNLWSPGIIRCAIDEVISGPIDIISNGKTIARTVLRKFKGKFQYTRYHGGVINSSSDNALKETHVYELFYRGFGKPCPSTVNKLFNIEGMLAAPTNVYYTLGGYARVTMPMRDNCVISTSANVPRKSDWYFLLPESFGHEFTSEVTETVAGIDVKLHFALNNVVPGVQIERTYCTTTSVEPIKTVGVSLEGFNYKAISLEFVGVDGLRLKGVNELKSGMMSSGILIEAWDGTSNHYETDGLMRASFSNK